MEVFPRASNFYRSILKGQEPSVAPSYVQMIHVEIHPELTDLK